jgi:hypothetical protein
MLQSADLIFTYWIFAWFLLYYLLFPNLYNPKFALISGLIVNLVILCILIYNAVPLFYIIGFMIVILVTKISPLYLIRKTKIRTNDIYFTVCLFLIYVLYFWTKENKNLKQRRSELRNFLSGKGNSPIMKFFLS